MAILPVLPVLADELSAAIAERLLTPPLGAVHETAANDLAVVRAFYAGRDNAPIWVGAGGALAKANAMANVLSTADSDGLDPADYGADAIAALGGAGQPAYLSELEIRLSLGFVRYVADLGAGRLRPQQVDPELYVYPADVDRSAALEAAATATDMAALAATYRPRHGEYDRLRQALAALRAADTGGDVRVPPGRALKVGDQGARVAELRARLGQLGDLDGAGTAVDDERFDQALEVDVTRFQERHGLDTDGVVGAETLAALNVPLRDRMRQILLNMERWRWMPEDFGPRHIVVNLADYTLEYLVGNAVTFRTRVIVGAAYHRTPVFTAPMRYLEFNPFWNVTDRIARKELLPKIKRDPELLAREHMKVLAGWGDDAAEVAPATIDWAQIDPRTFTYRLRQEPGPDNALGVVKFMLPNRFNVYLHDTPTKELFGRARRNFSHGCIRVQAPEQLAVDVLAGQNGWTAAKIGAVISAGKRQIVTLAAPLPVYITYLTARALDDGRLEFRDDPYGRDAILADALLGPRAGFRH